VWVVVSSKAGRCLCRFGVQGSLCRLLPLVWPRVHLRSSASDPRSILQHNLSPERDSKLRTRTSLLGGSSDRLQRVRLQPLSRPSLLLST
jgi:hypothetical protein